MRSFHYYLDPGHLFTSGWLMVGGVFWTATYILIARQSFRDKAYGIPMFAICLNITWESILLRSCVGSGDPLGLCPRPTGGFLLGLAENAGVFVDVAWFTLDCVLFYQLFRFGRAFQPYRQIREHWAAVLVSCLVLCLFLQLGFGLFYDDTFLIRDAFIINLVMSLSFIPLCLDRERHGMKGLSWSAAWTKLGGNLFYVIGVMVVHLGSASMVGVSEETDLFMYVLFVSTLACDIIYILLLRQARHSPLQVAAVPA
jgi:hypothetical protein